MSALQIVSYVVVQKGMGHKEEQGKLWQNHDTAIVDSAVGKMHVMG